MVPVDLVLTTGLVSSVPPLVGILQWRPYALVPDLVQAMESVVSHSDGATILVLGAGWSTHKSS